MQLFKSFFIGGYECSDMINRWGKRVDLLALTDHHNRVEEDYALLAAAGIRTVREGIRWSVVEKERYKYDFSEVKQRILAAQRAGLQQLWDICDFGYPDGLNPTDIQFSDRLVAVCKAFTKLYSLCTDDPLIITPINEISFLSYLSGDVACTVPFMTDSGGLIKYHLCKAAIKAIEAIKRINPVAKILLAEPLIRIHPLKGESITDTIRAFNEGQFEVMDMITGRTNPKLGGRPEYMDLAGFNYYYNNQWEHGGVGLCWKIEKSRLDFPGLLKLASDRYDKPVLLTETGHFGDERSLWMEQITEECIMAMEKGVDLQGICIYPVLDRPDWDDPDKYIPCGIWGYNTKTKERFVEATYLDTVKACIKNIEKFRWSKQGKSSSAMDVIRN